MNGGKGGMDLKKNIDLKRIQKGVQVGCGCDKVVEVGRSDGCGRNSL